MHHIFRRGALGGFFDWIKAHLSPLALLPFDDKSGTVYRDLSGNGDLTINGTANFETGTSTLFVDAGQSIDISTNQKGVRANSPGTASGDFTFLGIYRVETLATTLRIAECIDSASPGTLRRIMWTQGGKLGYYDGAVRTTGRSINTPGFIAMLSTAVTEADLTVRFFENGLEFATSPAFAGAIPSGLTRNFAWGDYAIAVANPAYGKHYLGLMADKAMTRRDHYNLWKQATEGKTHYWYEVLGTLSGATAATSTSPPLPPSSVIFHAPCWEEAGAQAIDVSGNENHATWVGGPSLGQAPLGDDEVYSVALNGTTQYLDATAALVDYSTTSFTVSVRFTATASLDTLFNASSGSSEFIAAFTVGSDVYVRAMGAGATTQTIIINAGVDGLPHDLCIRWNQSTLTLEAWLDGVSGGSIVMTGLTPAAPTRCTFGDGTNLTGVGGLLGNISLPAISNIAESDADCVILSGG